MSSSEADPEFDISKISDPAIRRAYEASRLKRLDKDTAAQIANAEVRAKFKLEIKFRQDRKSFGYNAISWQAYESGKHLHGGGDELIYWCIAKRGDGGCGAYITGNNIIQGVALCTNCKRQINAEMLTANFVINMSIKKLADESAKLWTKLDGSADLYCKFSREDIRYKIMEEKVGADRARELQGLLIYPLANIIKDTAAGASLSSRFEAFFRS